MEPIGYMDRELINIHVIITQVLKLYNFYKFIYVDYVYGTDLHVIFFYTTNLERLASV